MVTGGTVGAVIGPLLVGPSAGLATRLRLTDLSGPYAASALLFGLAAALIALRLRPEPRELAREVAAAHAPAGGGVAARRWTAILRDPQVVSAVLSLVAAQAVMVMVMVITSLHMTHHDHALSAVSFVISLHVIGMYAFSLSPDGWPTVGAGRRRSRSAPASWSSPARWRRCRRACSRWRARSSRSGSAGTSATSAGPPGSPTA